MKPLSCTLLSALKSRIQVLERLLQLGVFLCLTGIFYFPTMGGYKTFVKVFLFLPAVVILVSNAKIRNTLRLAPEFQFFLIFVSLGVMSAAWSGSGHEYSQIKIAVYVVLFAIGLISCEYSRPGSLEKAIYAGIIIAAISAGYAVIYFFWVRGMPLDQRLKGYGLLPSSTLSMFAYGFFFVALLDLLAAKRLSATMYMLLGFSLVSLAAFILGTQSRGAIVAISLYGIAQCLLLRTRGSLILCAGVLVSVVLIIYFKSDILLTRGFSYRPQIWLRGIEMAMETPWFGAGLGTDYQVTIDSGRSWDHPHSMLVMILMDMGITGLITWLGLNLYISIKLYKSDLSTRGLSLGLLGFSVVAVVFDGMGPFVRLGPIWFVSWVPLVVGMAWLISNRQKVH